MITTITLPNKLAAVSAYMNGTTFTVTDGHTDNAYIFGSAGTLADTLRFYRPYRVIRRDIASGKIMALGNGGTVYFLTPELNETYGTCFGTGVNDISFISSDGTETAVVKDGSVESRDCRGRLIRTLLPQSRNAYYTGYVTAGSTVAYSYTQNGITLVKVVTPSGVFGGILPCRFTLRSLIASAPDTIYMLLGYKYIYAYIYPLYITGRFLLPETETFCP